MITLNEVTLSRELDELIEKLINRGAFPGAVLLVCKKTEVLHFKAYGMSVLVPVRKNMTLSTIFDLASLTKPIATATSVMKLYEKGKIDLYDKVKEYIPEFNIEGKREITIWNLLTHTSGLPAWLPLYRMCKSKDDVLKVIAKVKLTCKVKSKVIYSDLNFILLRYVIEEVSKIPFDIYVKKSLLKLLDMKDTMFNPPPKIKERIAATEYCKWRNRIVWGEVHDENAYFLNGVSGHAGLFSTAYDLYLFSNMMLSYGIYKGTRVLSTKSIELMIENHTKGLNSPRGLGWALKERGWQGGKLISKRTYGHTGFTGTSLFIDPEREVAIILLTNRVHPTRENIKILKARPMIHDKIISLIDQLLTP